MKLFYTWLFALLITGVQAQSPEAHYDLTKSTKDLTSNGWDGILLGNAHLSSGGLYVGPANNATNAMRLPHQVLDSAEDFSIYARIYLESFSSDVTTLISGYDGGDQLEFSFGDGWVRVIIADDHKYSFKYSLPLWQWKQFLLIRRKGYLRLIVDSNFDDSMHVKQLPITVGDSALIVGHEQDIKGGGFSTSTCFNGHIKSLSIYRKALTENGIRTVLNIKASSIVHFYPKNSFEITTNAHGITVRNPDRVIIRVDVFSSSAGTIAQYERTNAPSVQLKIPSEFRNSIFFVSIQTDRRQRLIKRVYF